MNKFSLVVAYWKHGRGIGANGNLPWKPLKDDLKFFKELTSNVSSNNETSVNSVIMGKKTWLSLPSKFRPLPGRLNVVVSSTLLNYKQSGSILQENYNENYQKVYKTSDYFNEFTRTTTTNNEAIIIDTNNIGHCIVVRASHRLLTGF